MSTQPVQLIETMRIEPGRNLPLLDGHLHRLRCSCTELGYVWPGEQLADAIRSELQQADPNYRHRLRLLVSKDGRFTLESGLLPDTPTPVLIRLAPAPLKADPFWLQYKTTQRSWYDEAQSWLAQSPAYFDVVYCNQNNELCEGSRSNVYILNDAGLWLTPPQRCGLLPGVQRKALIDAGQVKTALITRDEFLRARAIRVSNALRGWLEAVLSDSVEGTPADNQG